MPIPNSVYYKSVDIEETSVIQQRYQRIGYTLLKRIHCGDAVFCVIKDNKDPTKIICVTPKFIFNPDSLTSDELETCEQLLDD
jgi:hypothetical protein